MNRWSKRKLLAAVSRNKAQSLRKISGRKWKASWETATARGWKRQMQETARWGSGNYRHAQCKFYQLYLFKGINDNWIHTVYQVTIIC